MLYYILLYYIIYVYIVCIIESLMIYLQAQVRLARQAPARCPTWCPETKRKSTRNGMFETKISHDTRILNGKMSVFIGMQKKTSAIIQKMDC